VHFKSLHIVIINILVYRTERWTRTMWLANSDKSKWWPKR